VSSITPVAVLRRTSRFYAWSMTLLLVFVGRS